MADVQFPLIAKIFITGMVECKNGLHIGSVSEQFAIGGIDSPVAKDVLTGEPYIPGSSLKGKLRSLTEKALNKKLTPQKGKEEIRQHRCANWEGALQCAVCRLFGWITADDAASEKAKIPSSLIVRDLPLENGDYIASRITSPLKFTEWKTENALDRITAAANPRDIERVPRGAQFKLELVYNISNENRQWLSHDLKTLICSMCLLEDDYLGGNGSRGSGSVWLFVDAVRARQPKYYFAETAEEKSSNEFCWPYQKKQQQGQNMAKKEWKQEDEKEDKTEDLLRVSEFKERKLRQLVEELERWIPVG